MNRLMIIIVVLLVIVCLFGCGGQPGPALTSTGPTTPPATTQTPTAANWQFDTTAAVPGKVPISFAGSISQSGSKVSGVLHVGGSDCFDPAATIVLTGTVTAGSTSLMSTAIDGQVVTFTGSFIGNAFSGTYRIDGGCAAGEQGRVTGRNIPYIANQQSGTFTSYARTTFSVAGDIAQSASPSPDGSFEVSGSATFDTSCFRTGTIRPGTFSSGSFILGRTVVLEMDTSNGPSPLLGP